MTTPKDLSGTCSVAAFHRAIELGHVDLARLIDLNNNNDASCTPSPQCAALPAGWPEAVAHRLAWAMIQTVNFRDTPHYRDAFVTDARSQIVYHDGFDDLRRWMEELDIQLGIPDPPGALMPLLTVVGMRALTDRLGPDRMEAFVTRLRQEGPELEKRVAGQCRCRPRVRPLSAITSATRRRWAGMPG